MRRPEPLRAASLSAFVPAVAVLVVWTSLLPAAGGFHPRDWLPAGLALTAILATTMVGLRRILPPRLPRRPLLVLALFVGWCFVSLSWSSGPGGGWDGANLLAVTVLTGWTLALVPWDAASAEWAVFAFVVVVALVCAVVLIGAVRAPDLAPRFTDGRYNQPLDYPNGSAALCVLAGLGGLLMGARPGKPLAFKLAMMASGTFLVSLSVLSQSRGAVLAGLVASVAAIAFSPSRWRLLAAFATAAAGIAVSAGPAFRVYDLATTTGVVSGALADAAWALAAATLIGVVGGLAIGLADRGVRRTERLADVSRYAGIGLCVAVLVAVVAGLGLNAGRIAGGVEDQWQALRSPGERFGGALANPSGQQRLTTVDPIERYDYWRVSLRGLRDRPLGGDGVGGFEPRYTAERRFPKPSIYPHNLALRAVGETGLVGFGLFVAFLALILAGLLRGIRRAPRGDRTLIAVAVTWLAYLALHSSLDWLEAYPTIVGPVLGLLVITLVVRDGGAPGSQRSRAAAPATGPARWLLPAGAVVTLGLLAASLTAPWIALRFREQAVVGWQADPQLALRTLDRAARWNPLSERPSLHAGLIALQIGDSGSARSELHRSTDRQPTWIAYVGLALLAAEDGDRTAAQGFIARARAVSPLEPRVADAAERLRDGTPLDAAEAVRTLLARTPADASTFS